MPPRSGCFRNVAAQFRAIRAASLALAVGPGTWLFPSDENSTGHQKSLKTVWRLTLRQAKVSYFRIYDLRSTYATRLIKRGRRGGRVRVTQMVRQGDARVLKKYLQMKLQMKRDALKKMNPTPTKAGQVLTRTGPTDGVLSRFGHGRMAAHGCAEPVSADHRLRSARTKISVSLQNRLIQMFKFILIADARPNLRSSLQQSDPCRERRHSNEELAMLQDKRPRRVSPRLQLEKCSWTYFKKIVDSPFDDARLDSLLAVRTRGAWPHTLDKGESGSLSEASHWCFHSERSCAVGIVRRISVYKDRRTSGVRTCSGRKPTPTTRAGMRRRIGQRRSSLNGQGSESCFVLPSTRLIMLFWMAI